MSYKQILLSPPTLCNIVDSHQLSTLYISVYICQSQPPFIPSPSPLGIPTFVFYIFLEKNKAKLHEETASFALIPPWSWDLISGEVATVLQP